MLVEMNVYIRQEEVNIHKKGKECENQYFDAKNVTDFE